MSKKTFSPMNTPDNKSIEELRARNNALELSPEYQRILPKVMNEVYSQLVKEEIELSEC